SQEVYLLDSGRSALVVALKSSNLNPGDEVLLAAFNCPAVADAVFVAGGVPKYIDVDIEGQISLESVKQNFSSRTKVLVFTHPYGAVSKSRVLQLQQFCEEQGVVFINDLAQVIEDPLSIERFNHYGDMSVYSFGPEKHIFAMGGGALVVRNKDSISKV